MVNVNCALQHILLSYPQTPTAPYSAAFAIGFRGSWVQFR